MDKIKALDSHLTNMIAAGEVVERPSGVVKELVENSIDASATNIDIYIEEGGISLIEIVDNGLGMSRKDTKMAFKRHATSKIFTMQDLWSINTLGFRGEALPSIASVSKVEIISNNGQECTYLLLEKGKIVSEEVRASNKGTKISVTSLFENTPARLKHLRSVAYENSLIIGVIEKFAFSYPNISFNLYIDNKKTLATSGKNDLVEVVQVVYGHDAAKNSLIVEVRDYDYHINGVILLPSFNRANKNYMNIFINSRMIKSYRLNNSVIEAYSPFMPSDRYPIIILNIEMDSQLVDVNVHPAKWEVRLSKEKQLEELIKSTVSKLLYQQMRAPEITITKPVKEEIHFETLDLVDNVVYRQEEITKLPEYQPAEKIVEPTSRDYEVNEQQEEYIEEVNFFTTLNVIGQMHGNYILCENTDGLYIIDQHAAEERSNYEKYNALLESDKQDYIDLLIPFTIDVTHSQMAISKEIIEVFESVNLYFEVFGDKMLVLRTIPIWMQDVNLDTFTKEMLDKYLLGKDVSISSLRKKVVATMACHSSIRFNHALTIDEQRQVIANLAKCKQPFQCPHGRPTFIHLSNQQLIKEFKR